MGGHAGGFVDYDEVGVLEQDRQGDGFGPRDGGRDRWDAHGVDARLGPRRAAGDDDTVAADRAPGDQGLDAGAGQARRGVRQGLVQTAVFGGQRDFEQVSKDVVVEFRIGRVVDQDAAFRWRP